MFSSKMFVLISMALTAAIIASDAQTTPPSCASKLVPCAPYLNASSPPAECCDPLREAITNDLDCLCKLYENPTLLPSLGINITQALALPKACNISGDLNACTTGGAPGPSSEGLPPPVTPGGNNGSNGVNKFTWSGISFFLVICASLMLA
ncbi:protein YLS3-like [Solanum tuberosum]|nr:PREDICTED: protein YLS3-like [Solanum tuberosum]